MIIGLLFILPANSFAETGRYSYLNPSQTEAFKLICKMDFENAKHFLAASKHNSPLNPYNFYVQSFALTIELVLDGDRYKYLKSKSFEGKWLDSLNKLEYSVERQHVIASVKLHWALLKAVFGDGLAAAWNIRQAYLMLGELNKKRPDFAPAFVYYGALNVVLSSMPASYHWAAQLVGLTGDQQKGMVLIAKSKGVHEIADFEANIANLILKSHLEYPRKEVLDLANSIAGEFKNFDLVSLLIGWLYNKNYNSEGAKKIIQSITSARGATLVSHVMGVACFQTLDFNQAKKYFLKFLKETKGNSLKKDSYYRLSLIAITERDSIAVSKYKEKIKKAGSDNIFADKYAMVLSSYPNFAPAFILGKSSFEGGLFAQSMNYLNQFQPVTPMQKAEKKYYIGRIHESQGNYSQALIFYDESVKISPNTFYIGPLACIYGMKLSKSMNDLKMLSVLNGKFKKFNKYDFQKSIEDRANKINK